MKTPSYFINLAAIAVTLSSCNKNSFESPPSDEEITQMLLPPQVSKERMTQLASEGRYPYEWEFTVAKIQRGSRIKSKGEYGPEGTAVFPVRFTYSFNDFEILVGPADGRRVIRQGPGDGRREAILRSERTIEHRFWRNEFNEWVIDRR